MIEVIRQPNNLNREVWQFHAMTGHRLEIVVILEYYYKQNRSSARHKWISDEYYSRTGRGSSLKVGEVPLPDDVAQEALQKFMEQVKVVKEL